MTHETVKIPSAGKCARKLKIAFFFQFSIVLVLRFVITNNIPMYILTHVSLCTGARV